MLYQLIRPILFKLDPEKAHTFTLKTLNLAHKLGLMHFWPQPTLQPRSVMGLNFPTPIGLAAGFDKNGDYIDALAKLGFGFIEIGTITPQPQDGNPKPRIFRLPKENAIINRLGFNNKGAAYVAEQLKKTQYRGILGINIGKNKDTPTENALDDYRQCFRTLWPFASYITVNISSPNTMGLRDLQHGQLLQDLVQAMKKEQAIILAEHQRYIPLVIKLSPDLTAAELTALAAILLAEKIDAVIATNTTLSRPDGLDPRFAREQGGLSGAPLRELSTSVIGQLAGLLENKIPIIASGGVMDAEAIKEKLAAGASLVQVYSGLIYGGTGCLG